MEWLISIADELACSRSLKEFDIDMARVCKGMKWLNSSNLNNSFLLTGLWIGYHVDCIHITTLQGAVPRLLALDLVVKGQS